MATLLLGAVSKGSHLRDGGLEHNVCNRLSGRAQHGEHHHQHIRSAGGWVSGEMDHGLETIAIIHCHWRDTACQRQNTHEIEERMQRPPVRGNHPFPLRAQERERNKETKTFTPTHLPPVTSQVSARPRGACLCPFLLLGDREQGT